MIMDIELNKKKNAYQCFKIILLILAPFALYFIFYGMSDKIIAISDGFEKCIILEKYGILCPGCGNTRCVKALLKGHFIKAFEYNITIPLIMLMFLFYYVCYIFKTAGLKIPQFVRREKVIVFLVIVLIVYYFIRNLFY